MDPEARIPDAAFPLRTERLVLRRYGEGDFDALYALQSREDVTRFSYWGPRDRDAVRESLAKKMRAGLITGADENLALAITLAAGGAHVGDVNLNVVSREHAQGEVGYMVHPDHQGRRYAAEAVRPLLRLAFEVLGLHRVVGRLEARNTASARTLERLGMRREAHLVENEHVRGEWQSELVYAILAREWRAHPG